MLMFKIVFLFLFTFIISSQQHQCVHHLYTQDLTPNYYNDHFYSRFLVSQEYQNIRIFADYSYLQSQTQDDTALNIIKRIVNISTLYYYNAVKVQRADRIFFNKTISKCQILNVPFEYQQFGVVADVAIFVSSTNQPNKEYAAKAIHCQQSMSSKRPTFGQMFFNVASLRYDQHGFQKILYVGLHQMLHVIGFSAYLYDQYPAGNPLVNDSGKYYLTSPQISQRIEKHFKCSSAKGMPLEDEVNQVITRNGKIYAPSHWQRKAVGSQYMTSSGKQSSYISPFSLALLESTGWYLVDYSYSEQVDFGKNKGCQFLSFTNCNFPQFCNHRDLRCNWENFGSGHCLADRYSGQCRMVNYYSNTICYDYSFLSKNLNSQMQAYEYEGSGSRCFASDFRQDGSDPTILNTRCYKTFCSFSGKYIFIIIKKQVQKRISTLVLVCSEPLKQMKGPDGLIGVLTCPSSFESFCNQKKACTNHCNKNGLCINGKCLCSLNKDTSDGCLDQQLTIAPIGTTGGLLHSRRKFVDTLTGQTIQLESNPKNKPKGNWYRKYKNNVNFSKSQKEKFNETKCTNEIYFKKYSFNTPCFSGTFLDEVFGICLSCREYFNCSKCSSEGCYFCESGKFPNKGHC